MRGLDRSFRVRLLLAAALLVAYGAGRICRAQQLVVGAPVAVAPDSPDADAEAGVNTDHQTVILEVAQPNNAAVPPPQAVFMMTDDQLDQWVFGGPRNSRAGLNKLDSLLILQVDDVARTCHLSEPQKKKLLLAGRGDIKRFFDKVEEKRKKFEKVKTDQNKISEIYQEIVPLQSALNSGLFGDGSIYSKTLKRVLGEEEDARYQKVVCDKNQFRYRAKVELVVAQLDQSVGFRDEQRRKLVDLILSETQPPKRFGQYDYYLVMFQAGKIPEAKLKPLFDDKQWAFLNRQLNQMRGMEHSLRNQGMLPAKDEAREIADEFVKALRDPSQRAREQELPADVFAPPSDVERGVKEPGPGPKMK